MDDTGQELDLINELRSYYHDISNYMVTASLTLELCDNSPQLAQADFEALKEQVAVTIKKLRQSQEILVQLADLVSNDDEVEFETSQASLKTKFD